MKQRTDLPDAQQPREEELAEKTEQPIRSESEWLKMLEELRIREASLQQLEAQLSRAQQAQLEMQQQLENAYMSHLLPQIDLSPGGIILRANHRARHLLTGDPLTNITNHPFARYVEPEDIPQWLDIFEELKQPHAEIHCEIAITCANTTTKKVRMESFPWRPFEEDNKHVSRLGMIELLSPQSQVTTDPLLEKRMEGLNRQSLFGLAFVSDKGYITELNDCFARLFGLSAEECVGESFEALLLSRKPVDAQGRINPQLHPLPTSQDWQDFFQRWERWSGYIRPKRQDDSFIYHVELLWSENENQYAQSLGEVIALVHDVTDLIRSSELKEDFISIVSHELRTPLTSTLASLKLIDGGVCGEIPAKAKHMLLIALRNGDRLQRLIEDLLDLGKVTSEQVQINLETSHLLPMVHQAIIQHLTIFERHKVSYQLTHQIEDCFVTVDPSRLHQILGNLLTNAAKHSPKGGTVLVRAQQAPEGKIHICIEDSGPGVPESFRPHLFKKFTQANVSANQHTSGTGLGLFLSNKLAEMMNGSLYYETRDEGGSRFVCELPETFPDNQS